MRSRMHSSIPVVCDRCRAEGLAGEAGFTDLGGLLDFEPVPRRPRADGWSGEVQRAFIAALAVTGSDRQAARAVGKAQFGVDQLKKARGNEGFLLAHERAMAMAAEEKTRRLAAGLSAVTAPAAHWRPSEPAWGRAASRAGRRLPAAEPAELSEEQKKQVQLQLLGALLRNYLLKLKAERRVRLEGRIAEADLYVRQLTMLEVALDGISGDGMTLLRDVRLGGFPLVQVAETPMSRLLDAARREHWAACGDPPRPEHPPRHLLKEQEGGLGTEPLPATRGGLPESHEEQRRAFDDQHAVDAAAHVAWEAEARRDFERRRDSDAGKKGTVTR